MKKRNFLGLLITLFALSACSALGFPGNGVITATADPRIIQITVTNTPGNGGIVPPSATAVAALPTAVTLAPTSDTTPTVGSVPTSGALPPGPSVTPQPVVSATPNIFPTDTRLQVYIAQEDFEGGYMFWVQPIGQMWVLLPDNITNSAPGTQPTSGQWRVYADPFKEGEAETDPALNPPQGRYQPRRGFGKLWRETPELRNNLGWALTPEFALQTAYAYQPGGSVNAQGQYVPGPGRHSLITLSRNTFEFIEPDPAKGEKVGRWRKAG